MKSANPISNFTALFCWLAVIASLASAQAQSSTPVRRVSGSSGSSAPVVTTNEQALVVANNAFAFDLMTELVQEAPQANTFISPYSVSSALEMMAAGAAGQTAAEMQQVLQTADLPASTIYPAFKSLDQQLAGRADVTLTLANSLWYQNGLQLKRAFVATNEDWFQAWPTGVNFRQSLTAQMINNWARQKTAGRIRNIVTYPFPAGTELILANAIYFKGKWVTPFDPNLTQPGDFYPTGGQTEQAQMMSQFGTFAYQAGPDFQAVELPYNGGLQMELFLPAPTSSPQAVLAELSTNGQWAAVQSNFSQQQGTVVLPKFQFDYDVLLNDPLEALGMVSAFGTSANFSGITAQPLKIDFVKQKSYVEVDEQGTEATATTVVGVITTTVSAPFEPFRMVLDRPFFFAISDTNTGSILFMGVVNDPASD
jgi:serpin B